MVSAGLRETKRFQCAVDSAPLPPPPPQEGPLAGLGPEAGGREGSCSPVSGFFPGFLPEDLVESSSQEDPSLSPGQARTVPVMG